MNLIKVTEDIFHYENLLTAEECEKVINLFHKLEEKDPDYWKSISFYESYSGSYPEDGNPLMAEVGLPSNWFKELEDKFRACAAEVAGQTPEKMSKISFHVQRWLAGAFAPKHSDNSDNDGNLGAFTRSRYACYVKYCRINNKKYIYKYYSKFMYRTQCTTIYTYRFKKDRANYIKLGANAGHLSFTTSMPDNITFYGTALTGNATPPIDDPYQIATISNVFNDLNLPYFQKVIVNSNSIVKYIRL